MRTIIMADVTLQNAALNANLSFKDKIDLAAMIDRLKVQRIELPPIQNQRADSLLIKSIVTVVKNAQLAVALPPEGEEVPLTVKALGEAKHARLQLRVPLSTPQMEYIYHKKPQAMLEMIEKRLDECKAAGLETEFVAEDATRASMDFLCRVLSLVLAKGVCAVTLCDDAGQKLPYEMATFINEVRGNVPGLERVTLGLHASNEICMADACGVAALGCGVDELKLSAYLANCMSLQNMVKLLSQKQEELGAATSVRTAEMNRVSRSIAQLFTRNFTDAENREPAREEGFLTRFDSRETIAAAANKLGYEISGEDEERIWQAFQTIIAKKEKITLREMEAIIASESMQVPAAYHMSSYVINTGSGISSMAHMKLLYHDREQEGIAVGDGAVAAAFAAIEQATQRHFDLDDFRIQSVSEGREAVGSTLVKLRAHGKVYSGQGISTDIVGASIVAYISALNKIVFEEEQA